MEKMQSEKQKQKEGDTYQAGAFGRNQQPQAVVATATGRRGEEEEEEGDKEE